MIMMSRSMSLRSSNPMELFTLPLTLIFQGYDLCKFTFGPYLGYYWIKHCQLLRQCSLGKGVYKN